MISVNCFLFFEFTIISPFLFKNIEAKGGGFGDDYYRGGRGHRGRDSTYGEGGGWLGGFGSQSATIGVIIGLLVFTVFVICIIFFCDCNDNDDNDRLEENESRNDVLEVEYKPGKAFSPIEENANCENVVEQSYYSGGKKWVKGCDGWRQLDGNETIEEQKIKEFDDMYKEMEREYGTLMEDIKNQYGENSKEAIDYKKQLIDMKKSMDEAKALVEERKREFETIKKSKIESENQTINDMEINMNDNLRIKKDVIDLVDVRIQENSIKSDDKKETCEQPSNKKDVIDLVELRRNFFDS